MRPEASLWPASPQNGELLRRDELSCMELVEIDPARHVGRIPDDRLRTWLLNFVHQCRHLATKDVVDLQADVRRMRQIVADRGARVEGIGVVLVEAESG